MIPLPLLTWLSPGFPVGAFAFSGGLEAAVAGGAVGGGMVPGGTAKSEPGRGRPETCEQDVLAWCEAQLRGGALRNDAVLMGMAMCASGPGELHEIDALAIALAGSPSRERETRSLANAFVRAAEPWVRLPVLSAYPVALGHAATLVGARPEDAVAAFMLAGASAQVQAAQRLVPLGQTAASRILREIEPIIADTVPALARGGEDMLGTAAPVAEIAALRHTALSSALFRS